jgi:hypothetical protein
LKLISFTGGLINMERFNQLPQDKKDEILKRYFDNFKNYLNILQSYYDNIKENREKSIQFKYFFNNVNPEFMEMLKRYRRAQNILSENYTMLEAFLVADNAINQMQNNNVEVYRQLSESERKWIRLIAEDKGLVFAEYINNYAITLYNLSNETIVKLGFKQISKIYFLTIFPELKALFIYNNKLTSLEGLSTRTKEGIDCRRIARTIEDIA